MRSRLCLSSRANGTGTGDTWSFSGADERILRDCLNELVGFEAPDPGMRWDYETHDIVYDGDRWLAAVVLYDDDPNTFRYPMRIPPAQGAWTVEGAMRLADLLPDRLADVRDAICRRFADE